MINRVLCLFCIFLLGVGICSCGDDDKLQTIEVVSLSTIDYTTELSELTDGGRIDNLLITYYSGKEEDAKDKGNCIFYYHGTKPSSVWWLIMYDNGRRYWVHEDGKIPQPRYAFLVDGMQILITGHWIHSDGSFTCEWREPYAIVDYLLEIESLKLVVP